MTFTRIITHYLRLALGTLAWQVARRLTPPRTFARRCVRVAASVSL